jgi:hypothetical protein
LFCTISIQANDAAVRKVGNWEMRKAESFEDGKEEGDLRESVCGCTCVSIDLFGRVSGNWDGNWRTYKSPASRSGDLPTLPT